MFLVKFRVRFLIGNCIMNMLNQIFLVWCGLTSTFLYFSAAYSHSDADVLNQSLLEANIATEVCLTVLDTLSIFIMGFKVQFTKN